MTDSISLPETPGAEYAERIKHLRASVGLTQAALAKRLGVSFQTVNRWENSKSAAQTGGTTLYTLAGANLKSDAQTKYTNSSSKVWTFAVPSPGAAALVGLAALITSRRRN